MNYDDVYSIGYEEGTKITIEAVIELILLTDRENADNIKQDPKLASFLLLELVEKIKKLE